jgi:HK97 family phage portal protein
VFARLKQIFTRAAPPPSISYGYWPNVSLASASVSGEGALRIAACYRAVNLIAGDIARLPVEIDGSSIASYLLTDDPSRWHTQYEFRRAIMVQALLYGNGFAYIARDGRGAPAELQLLGVGSVTLEVSREGVFYRHSDLGSIRTEDVFHLKALSTDGMWGKSPISTASDSFALGVNLSSTANSVFSNAGVPKIAIMHPGQMSPEAQQRIANSYAERHAGAANAGRPLVLTEGMKVETIGGSLEDSVFVQASQFTVDEIARIFGVPSAYLNQASGGISGIEPLMRTYVDGCLSHWATQYGQEFRRKVMGQMGSVVWDFDLVLRPSLAETMAALRTGVEASIITRNEARSWLDLEALEGGDELILAKNMGTGGGSTNLGDDTSESSGGIGDFVN